MISQLYDLYSKLSRRFSKKSSFDYHDRIMVFPWNDFFTMPYFPYALLHLGIISNQGIDEVLLRTENWTPRA